jgi:hypothetical protein
MGVWWMIRAGRQPTPTPVAEAAAPTTPQPTTVPETRPSTEPKSETPPTKKTAPDKGKSGADNAAPPAIPRPPASEATKTEKPEAKHKETDNSKNAGENSKSALSLRSLAKEFLEGFKKWREAISDPKHFVQPGFDPTEDQLIEGIEFYLMLFSVSFVFLAPLVLTSKGETADKSKAAINAAIGLMFTGILAMTWFFAFWLMGGTSTIAGTFVTYIYAAGPYLPLFSALGLLIYTGLPERYRRAAMNPATTQAAMNAAVQDPETSKGPVMLGGCAAVGIMIWSMIVVFRCFSYVHEVNGWKLAGAIVLSLIVSAPVSAVLKKLSALIQGTPGVSESLPEGI